MTRVGRRLIEDFLLPSLNDQRYGDLLKWIDRDKCYFSIRWSHKNAAKWNLQDTAVFQDWDKLKGHYRPEIKGYYMQAKQRFRAALYKLNTVRKLPCDDKHVKKYQLVLDNERRSCTNYMGKSRMRKVIPKIEEGQRSIPTSVICKNTAYVAKQESFSAPSSPATSIKSENSEHAEEILSFDYNNTKIKEECVGKPASSQKMWHSSQLSFSHANSTLKEKKVFPLGSNIPTNCGQRTPHVPIQPVPVYNKCSQLVLSAPRHRYESPHVVVVPTFNIHNSEKTLKEKKGLYNLAFGATKQSSEVALNLSIKSEACSLSVTNR